MIIINSAAYVVSEFQNELGEIPPCMLPLGNQKLIQHQVNALKKFLNEKIILSLPLSYKLTAAEKKLFEELCLEVVLIPDNFSLANALIYVINVSACIDEHVRVLHGDTLIYDFPDELDRISIAHTTTEYKWKTVFHNEENNTNLVWAGFFSFSDKKTFLKALSLSNGNFINAILRYKNDKNSKEVECNEWYDFGHINTYFISRSFITTQRAFNSIIINDGILCKTGNPHIKIEAEAEWFTKIPPSIKKYTPQFISSGKNDKGNPFYQLEYLPYLSLNEIFVHGRNSILFWNKQFDLFVKYFEESRVCINKKDDELYDQVLFDAKSLYESKTISRLSEFNSSDFLNFDRVEVINKRKVSIKDIAIECINRTLELPLVPAILHGDFCFSNILYDSRSQKIKVIDPRGLSYNKNFTIYGDQKYDFAKLTHSVIGLYDFIISGRYEIKLNSDGCEYIYFEIDERLERIQKVFFEKKFIDNIYVKDIIPLVVLLFLSMLPLHKDRPDRQKAMILNAFRLYEMIFNK